MKIAIKVSEVASLIGMNCFRSRDTILRYIKNRIYTNYQFDDSVTLTRDAIETLIECSQNHHIANSGDRPVDTLCRQLLQRQQRETIDDEDQCHLLSTLSLNSPDKYVCEFDTFYVYCFKHEVSIHEGLIIECKSRLSDKVKHFIPLIDLVHIQFYLLLTQCRRCLLCETWPDNHERNTYIKFDQSKLDAYIALLADAVNYIRN